jgi:hypothetical protein
MDLVFGASFDYGRLGLAIIALGMGFHLVAGTLNQAALAQGRDRAAAGAWLVAAAAFVATAWGIAGLGFLPRLDVAGALGVPLLLLFLWRGRNRAVYAGVFVVVCALELYGTWLGVWRWAEVLPGLGIPDGNPPSGVASGYVCFDVFAVAVAARLAGWNPLRRVGVERA